VTTYFQEDETEETYSVFKERVKHSWSGFFSAPIDIIEYFAKFVLLANVPEGRPERF